MIIRRRFEHRLQDVRDDIWRLGDGAAQALGLAVSSLYTGNLSIASWVVDNDDELDRLHRSLEERVFMLFATQQPIVARDLRLLTVVTAIASELARIGDYAAVVARCAHRATTYEVCIPPPRDIERMGNAAQGMLETGIQAFLHQDADRARSLPSASDEIADLHERVQPLLCNMIRADVRCLDSAHDLLHIVRVLERTADRTMTIGERVIYLVTNTREDLRRTTSR